MAKLNLNGYSLLKVAGTDATKFLQGQLTCDVEKVNDTEANLGAHCNRQGRVISLFRIFKFQDAYYLWMPSELIAPSLSQLQKYALFSQVELSQVDASSIGYIGDALQDSADINLTIEANQRWLQISFSAPTGDDQTIDWHRYDIEQRIPRLYPDTIGKFLPHYINLVTLGGVSFTKGCYTGQEVIARMEHRTTIKQHLQILTLDTAHKPGEKIVLDGKKLGECVDFLMNEAGNYSLLAIIKDDNQ